MSRITIQLYLHDVPEEFGGATTFLGKTKDFACQPKCGSALVFTQNLLHEGSLVREGVKYTMRTWPKGYKISIQTLADYKE